MKLISSYVPEEFVKEKERVEKTWRLIIAQGLNAEKKIRELEGESEYFQKRCYDLNKEVENLRKKFAILEHNQKTFIERNPQLIKKNKVLNNF